MKKLVLVLTTLAAASVGAQTIYSGEADQQRRERNREEALSHYRGSATNQAASRTRSASMGDKGTADSSVRQSAHRAADSTRRVTHRAAEATRRAGHKTAAKAREITARVDAKMPAKTQPSVNPNGINPVSTDPKSPTAASNGIVK